MVAIVNATRLVEEIGDEYPMGMRFYLTNGGVFDMDMETVNQILTVDTTIFNDEELIEYNGEYLTENEYYEGIRYKDQSHDERYRKLVKDFNITPEERQKLIEEYSKAELDLIKQEIHRFLPIKFKLQSAIYIYDNYQRNKNIYVGLKDTQVKVLKDYMIYVSKEMFRSVQGDITFKKSLDKAQQLTYLMGDADDWVYGGTEDTGDFGGGHCDLGHALRYKHFAYSPQLRKKITFGATCMSDFFQVSKDLLELIKNIQQNTLTEIKVVTSLYKLGLSNEYNDSLDVHNTHITLKELDKQGVGWTYKESIELGLLNEFIENKLPVPTRLAKTVREIQRKAINRYKKKQEEQTRNQEQPKSDEKVKLEEQVNETKQETQSNSDKWNTKKQSKNNVLPEQLEEKVNGNIFNNLNNTSQQNNTSNKQNQEKPDVTVEISTRPPYTVSEEMKGVSRHLEKVLSVFGSEQSLKGLPYLVMFINNSLYGSPEYREIEQSFKYTYDYESLRPKRYVNRHYAKQLGISEDKLTILEKLSVLAEVDKTPTSLKTIKYIVDKLSYNEGLDNGVIDIIDNIEVIAQLMNIVPNRDENKGLYDNVSYSGNNIVRDVYFKASTVKGLELKDSNTRELLGVYDILSGESKNGYTQHKNLLKSDDCELLKVILSLNAYNPETKEMTEKAINKGLEYFRRVVDTRSQLGKIVYNAINNDKQAFERIESALTRTIKEKNLTVAEETELNIALETLAYGVIKETRTSMENMDIRTDKQVRLVRKGRLKTNEEKAKELNKILFELKKDYTFKYNQDVLNNKGILDDNVENAYEYIHAVLVEYINEQGVVNNPREYRGLSLNQIKQIDQTYYKYLHYVLNQGETFAYKVLTTVKERPFFTEKQLASVTIGIEDLERKRTSEEKTNKPMESLYSDMDDDDIPF